MNLITKFFPIIVCLAGIFFLVSCNGEIIIDDDYDPDWAAKIFDKLLAPEVTIEFLRLSVKDDNIKAFYYCLAEEIRELYSFYEISSAWDEVKRKLDINPDNIKVVDVQPLEESPFPPVKAMFLIIEMIDSKGIKRREKMLFLGQQNENEKNINWRIYYPYEEYQGFDALPVEKEEEKKSKTETKPDEKK